MGRGPPTALCVWISVPVKHCGPFVDAPWESTGVPEPGPYWSPCKGASDARAKPPFSLPLAGRLRGCSKALLRGGRKAGTWGSPADTATVPASPTGGEGPRLCRGQMGTRTARLTGSRGRHVGSDKLSISIHLLNGCLIRGIQALTVSSGSALE